MATDILTKLRHLTREQRKRAAELGKANTGPALGCNFFHAIHDITLTPEQTWWAFCTMASESKYHYKGIKVGAEAVVEWLRSTPELSYCILGGGEPNKCKTPASSWYDIQ